MSKIFLFIGQPGSGKTTLANHLKKCFEMLPEWNSNKLIHIDGDDIREIFNNKDYSENGRRINIQRAYDIATFLNKKDYIVIISLVSPYIDLREELKKNSDAIEIYVHTTDIRGKEKYHVLDFQKPIEKFIDIDTSNNSEYNSIYEILMNDLYRKP